ncbi:NAD-dependent epimerase/dehydratase family protein [Xylophilus sp. Kf1]|nr:NAD-dependent epimerase/dehydratase family protein [Xylophilus sp. Kf1]
MPRSRPAPSDNPVNVLILGATGYIGSALVAAFDSPDIRLTTASRGAHAGRTDHRQVDTTRVESLTAAMQDIEVVVNCVAGDATAIGTGAACLVAAARRAGVKKIVHLSSMAVYGFGATRLLEDAPLVDTGNWYADAKIRAESEMARFAPDGEIVILRIGCVAGRGSSQWVRRIGDLLAARRIGDLGSLGDGWSNIVSIDDVCQAVVRSVYRPVSAGRVNILNLAAPDSPRWNTYFKDFAQSIDATPLRRISARRLKFESHLLAPATVIYGKVRKILPLLPVLGDPPLSPSLLRLFHHAGKLDTSRIETTHGMTFTGYDATVRQGAAWYVEERHRPSSA